MPNIRRVELLPLDPFFRGVRAIGTAVHAVLDEGTEGTRAVVVTLLAIASAVLKVFI